MDKRTEIRRKNMLTLLKESGLKNNEFAYEIGISAAYLTHIKNGKANGGKNIGQKTCESIESAFNKPSGWLDIEHKTISTIKSIAPIQNKQNTIKVQHLTATGGMGDLIPIDANHDSEITTIELTKNYIRTQLGVITKPDNLKLMSGIGDSMEGIFSSGDTLFVDIGVNAFLTEATYVIHFDDSIWVKCLARDGNGSYDIISNNKSYKTVKVKRDDPSFKVIGLVVGVLNLNKLI